MACAGWCLTVFEWEQGGSLHADFDQMDPGLWSGLPEEVLLEVVRKLPLRFSVVCKHWRHALIRHDVIGKRRCVASLGQEPADPGNLSPLAKLGMPMVRAHSFHMTALVDDLLYGSFYGGVLCFYTLDDQDFLKLFLCHAFEETWQTLPEVQLPGPSDQRLYIFMQESDIFVVKLKHVLEYSRTQSCWMPVVEFRWMPVVEFRWMPVVEFQSMADMHNMVVQPVMCEGVIYQLDEADDIHLLDVKKPDYELVFDMDIEIDAFWILEHNRVVYFLDRYHDTLDCRLISRETEESMVISSAQKEQWQPYFDFLHGVGMEDGGEVVSVFGYIVLCAASPPGSQDSGYLLALDTSQNTWSSVPTSRQEAMAILNLLP